MSVDVPNSHSMFQLVEVKIPLLANRVWACKWTWRREANGDFVVALTSIKDLSWSSERTNVLGLIDRHKSSKKAVLSELRGCYRIRKVTADVCKVTLVGQANLGGKVPKKVMSFLITNTMEYVPT
jgi:hypothetical protein